MISDLGTYEKKSFFEKGHILRLRKRLKNRKLNKFRGNTLKRSEDMTPKIIDQRLYTEGHERGPNDIGLYILATLGALSSLVFNK